jgi:hypothetical protein
LKRWKNGDIDAQQAVHESRLIRSYSDILPQLQVNFAFTKAYLAEKSGKKGGLAGAQCFIDLALFENRECKGFQFGPRIHWKEVGYKMAADFAPLLGMTYTRSRPAPKGLRSGLEVAQHLAGDADVLLALRAASSEVGANLGRAAGGG